MNLLRKLITEAVPMFRSKRSLWKTGMVVTSVLCVLMFLVGVPVTAAESVPRLAASGTVIVQATPTEDATVIALNKEQLNLQVEQLQNQIQNQNNWLSNNSTTLIAAFTTIVVALFGISQWGVNRRDERQKEKEAKDKELEDRKAERERRDEEQRRWLEDHKAERERRDEERFQVVCIGLGSKETEAKVGAAIILRTFLRPGYDQFYSQTFDLTVVHLRLRKANPNISDGVKRYFPEPPDSLSQALITIFKEAFPLVRGQEKKTSQLFDATGIQLDSTRLVAADLKYAWMPWASLRGVNLEGADLREANLHSIKLNEADLSGANLSGAWLTNADFSKANLHETNLSVARLRWANFGEADLREAKLNGARLREANFSGANLDKANFSGSDLSDAHLEEAQSLKSTDLRGVTGLTKEQLVACQTKGAIIDETSTTQPSKTALAAPSSSQSNDIPKEDNIVSPQQDLEP